MWEIAQSQRPNVLPFIRCRDPARSIEWLCRALGFETDYVARRDDGSIVFAHLRFGDSLIMVTPATDAVAVPAIDTVAAERNALITLPAEIEHGETQSSYFVVDDIEAHYRNAKEAGADIVLEIKTYQHGGCCYSCRDPDGHVWTFGTYGSWREQDPPVLRALTKFVRSAAMLDVPAAVADLRVALPATVGVLAVLAGFGVALWLAQAPAAEDAASADAEAQTVAVPQAQAKLTEERNDREASDRALSEVRERLSREQESREAAERVALELRDQLAEQPAKPAANAESEKVAGERAARPAAEEAERAAQEDLGRARAAAAAAAEQPTGVVTQTAPADGEPKAQIEERVVVTPPADEAATKEAAPKSAAQREDRLASSLLAEGRSLLAKGDAAAAAAEQPTEVVSQTAPADGEPKAQIGERVVVTPPADETATKEAAPAAQREDRLASSLLAEGRSLLAKGDAAAIAAEQPTEVVSQTAPADGEPKAQIGERVVVTPPADETATKEAAPKSAGQDEDQSASQLLAEGRSLLAKGDAAAIAAEQPTGVVSETAPADGEPKAQIGERVVVTPPADEAVTKEAVPKSAGPDEDQSASSLLANGRSLLAKGDLDGARRAFRRAAESGSAEGALAMGSTYDPASLARYGLEGSSADPESAKFWYRRAHELTQAAALKTKPVAHE